jgi:hypothetical protein
MEFASVSLDYDADTRWNALLKMLEIALQERNAINRMCKEFKQLEALKLSDLEWLFIAEVHEVMQPLYKKALLVSQTMPTIFRSTEIYWDLDNHFDNIIEMQGPYAFVNTQIQEAARAGRAKLDEYTKKMDVETLIIYSAAILDPWVKLYNLQTHLKEGAENVIDNLRTHFNEISPLPESELPSQCQDSAPSASTTATSFVGRSRRLQVESPRQRMLREIQEKHYSTAATTLIGEINDWFDFPPIQEPVPENIIIIIIIIPFYVLSESETM